MRPRRSSALLRRQRSLRADRVAHVEHGADLADDVLGRGDADELDDVHHRLCGVAREDVGESRLAEPARPDDRDHARVGQQRAEPGDVAVAAAQRARVVAHAAPDGAVERQQVAMRAAEPLAGVGADPLEQVLPVGLVALERRPGPAHHGLAAQQVGEQRLVVGALGVRGLQPGQRLGMRAGAAGSLRQDHAGGREIAGRRAADLGQRVGLVLARVRAVRPPAPAPRGPAWPRGRRRRPARRRRRARARRAGRSRPRPGPRRAGSRRRRARSRRRPVRSACARPAPAGSSPRSPAPRRPRPGRSAARRGPAARRRPPAPPAAPANAPPRQAPPASARPRAASRRRSPGPVYERR